MTISTIVDKCNAPIYMDKCSYDLGEEINRIAGVKIRSSRH